MEPQDSDERAEESYSWLSTSCSRRSRLHKQRVGGQASERGGERGALYILISIRPITPNLQALSRRAL